MKRLLVHVGYPKAASTTLQNGVFYELHKTKAINFLGRAWESNYFGPAKSKRVYKTWFRSVRDGAFAGMPDAGADLAFDFSADRLNLLSEGLFVANERHDTQFSEIPQHIGEYFRGKVDRLEVLFVLRNQQSLVMSHYVQNYRKMEQKSFAGYLHDRLSGDKKKTFKIFYFHDLVRRYAEVMGKDNIRFVFFEDLMHDVARFSQQMGVILGVEPEVVRKLLARSFLNQTSTGELGSVVRKLEPTWIGQRLGRRARAGLGRLVGGWEPPRKRVIVPHATEEEKAVIFDAFRQSNAKLGEEFGLSEPMKRYEYF